MKPFDPHLLRTAPAARLPVAVLAVVAVLQGLATIALAFALTSVVVAVVQVRPLTTPTGWLLAVFALRAVLGWTVERCAAWAGVEVSAAVRRAALARWLTTPAEDRPHPDRAVTLAASGTSAIEPYAARFLPALLASAVVPVLAVGTLVIVDWVSALIVVLTLPLLPFFAALIGKSTQDETDKRWRALASLSGHFLDVMRGLPTLVSYGRAELQTDVIREVSSRHRVATMRTLRLAFMSSAALELLASISVAIVAVTVGLRLSHGTMSLSAGLLAILLAPEAYWPIRKVGAEFHAAADGAEALQSLIAGLEPATGARPAPGPAAGALTRSTRDHDQLTVEVHDLTYTYPGSSAPVLQGISLTAGPGLTVITGSSGIGKSTLLDLIAGLRRPTSGACTSPRAHLVTQRPFLPAGTIRDALTLAGPATDTQIWEALRAVGFDGVVASLPLALATDIGDDGFGLSAGQRARLVLARAALTDAPVILLDEPTAHLDEHASQSVHDAISALAERHTVIVVTHRPELVARAHQHYHLSRESAQVQA